ncbi:MAG TPA: aspartate-semialdehyde dehydrogenase [Rhabdochlamydiaceae bacterium]|nr:aspartate-semialdehyde dehydrogenase [Rhabdochlamydiaceae bacterium]
MKIAIIGATGAVGRELLNVLEKRQFPLKELKCFASESSVGKKVPFRDQLIPVEALKEDSLEGVNFAFFSAGKKVSKQYAPLAQKSGTVMIDNTSAFRMDPGVPLVIPEINPHVLKSHKGILSCPNCIVAVMLMALAPLHKKYKIKRIVASTYQAASGAGQKAVEELLLETKAYLEKQPFERTVFPHPYAFNLFLHNSPVNEQGISEEEAKIVSETRKILEDETIQTTVTCVRIPVLRAHSISLNVEFREPITRNNALSILKEAPGVTLLEDWNQNRFPMPLDATFQDNIFCGRIREDLTQPNTLEMWVVGDQLLKGAALNCVQIAEKLMEDRENHRDTEKLSE